MASKTSSFNTIFGKRPALWAFIAYIGLSIGLTWPLILNLKSSLLGDFGDSRGAVWWLWAKTNGFLESAINPLISAPHGSKTDGVFSQPFLEWTLVGLTKAFDEIVAHNLFVLFSFPLTAIATFLFLNFLLKDAIASFFGGFIFGFCPAAVMQVMGGHQAYAFNLFVPLFLLSLFVNHRDFNFRSRLLVAMTFSSIFFTAIYIGYFCCFVGLLFLILDLQGFEFTSKSGTKVRLTKAVLKSYLAIGLMAISMIIPFTYKVVIGHIKSSEAELRETSQVRDLADLFTYSSRPWDFLIPSTEHPFLGGLFENFVRTHLHGSNLPEQTLYFGFFSFLLSLLGVSYYLRNNMPAERARLLRFFVWGALLMFILSLPPTIPVGDISLPTLSHYSYSIAPMFRAYGRAGIIMFLFVAGIVSICIATIRTRVDGLAYNTLILFCFIFIVFEYWSISPHSINYVSKPPEIYSWLAEQEGDFMIAIYPMTRHDEFSFFTYQFWQRIHRKRMVNGISELDKKPFDIYERVKNLNDDDGMALLKASGVKFVIVHERGYREGMIPQNLKRFYEREIASIDYNFGQIPAIPSSLRLVRSFGSDKVYSFSRK